VILIDLNQVMIANLMAGTKGGSQGIELSEPLLRHMVLNTLRAINVKFKNEYGATVICCDGRKVWRREVFPYYKASRKIARDKSPLDWGLIFATLTKIKEELKEFMPYRVVDVDTAEADDVIGVIIANNPVDGFGRGAKMLIVSGDFDFIQLHKYPGVSQWDNSRKRWLKGDPIVLLKKKIIRGDVGDGVPNFLSQDDSFVSKIRQKAIMTVKEEVWLTQDPSEFCDTPEKKANWKRNETMVDLSKTPADIAGEILDKYNIKPTKTREDVMAYFVKFGLRKMMQDVQDF